MIIFRTATADDIDAVYAIELEGHARWSRRQFADELGLAFSRFHIIEENGEIIGFAVAWIVADEIQLNDIGIRKDRRRSGLGSRLLERIVDDTRETHKPVRVILEVSALNETAQAFYRETGFEETGRRRGYYDEADAILMERVITT